MYLCDKRNRMHRLAVILMAFTLVISMSFGSASVVLAEDEQPAAIQDTYTIEGVTYYNTDSDSFSSDSNKFVKDVLLGQSSELEWNGYNRSMADLWLETAAGLMTGKDYMGQGGYTVAMDKAACNRSQSGNYTIGGKSYSTYRYPSPFSSDYDMKSSDMVSPKTAEEYLYQVAGINNRSVGTTGYFMDSSDANTTFVTAIKATGEEMRVAAVYFNNFRIIPLFPEDAGKNFVTSVVDDTSSTSGISASNVKNNTAQSISTTQTTSKDYSWSVSSSISTSESYSYEESIKVSTEFKFSIFEKLGIEAGFTATQAFEKAWTEENSYSDSSGSQQEISVDLPPYTNVMMTQRTTTADYITRFNCPVGISFDVTIVIYNRNGVNKVNVYDVNGNQLATNSPLVFTYGNNARKTLAQRYADFQGVSDRLDPDYVRWYNVTGFDGTGDTHIGEAIEKVTVSVPMSPAGAQFRQKMNVIAGEVAGLMPIYPLKKVRNDGSESMNLEIGDSVNTDDLEVSGLNEKNAPYYGFDKEKGSWKVVDDEGNELTGNDAPIQVVKESATGKTKAKAVNPGTCYLKYFIDEDVYNTADDPDHFATNDTLDSTAAIAVSVKENRTIDVRGSFTGYVNEAPAALDADGRLHAAVYDKDGIEIDADITWEKQEKSGIELSGNKVSFTKAGTYHVRACCGELKTGWVEITAKVRPSTEPQKEAAKPVPKTEPKTAVKVTKVNVYAKMVAKGKTQEVISWKKVKNAKGYQIYFAPCDNDESYNSCKLVKTIKGNNRFKFVKKYLKKGVPYKAYVQAYTVINGKKVAIGKSLLLHSTTNNITKDKKFTNAAKITSKKSKVTVKVGKTKKLKGQKLVLKKKGKKRLKHEDKFRYQSSNKKIATVSRKGVIKGKKAGSCKVYIVAENGASKTIKVTVKK